MPDITSTLLQDLRLSAAHYCKCEVAEPWGIDRTGGEAGTLLTTPGGFHAGLHSHTADYWAVVVQGTWRHEVPSTGEGKRLRLEPGAFWTQKRTELHDDWPPGKTPDRTPDKK